MVTEVSYSGLAAGSAYRVEDLYELQYSKSLYLRIIANRLSPKHEAVASKNSLRSRFCKNDNPLLRIRNKLGKLLGDII